MIYKFNLVEMVRHLCKISNVSTLGYYRFLKLKDIRKSKESKDIESRNIILKAFNNRGYKKNSRSIKMTL